MWAVVRKSCTLKVLHSFLSHYSFEGHPSIQTATSPSNHCFHLIRDWAETTCQPWCLARIGHRFRLPGPQRSRGLVRVAACFLSLNSPGIQRRVSHYRVSAPVFSPLADPQEASIWSQNSKTDMLGKGAQIPCLSEYFQKLPQSTSAYIPLAQVYHMATCSYRKNVEYFVKVMSNECYSVAAVKNR